MTVHAPAPKPCASCPYRRDVPSGIWAACEYSKLAQYDADMPYQPPQLFLCHQNDRDSDKSRLCAGWVGCHKPWNLLAIRIAEATLSDVDLEAVYDYTASVPLFVSGHQAAEHGMRDIDCPDEDAEEAIAEIAKRRKDIKHG